jgi:catechol 2,3-dioxygenase-like lactoylglutathione lyase family enzyme
VAADATGPISGVDHVVIAVKDLDRARAAYHRLGFTLSPRGDHSPPLGTANHTIMGRRDYLELLAVSAETEENRGLRRALAEGEGIVAVALATPDAAMARSAWQAAGVGPAETLRVSRPVHRSGGAPVEARFEIARLPDHALPGAEVFACGHGTREAVWVPELLDHPNTTVAVRAVTIAAPGPRGAAGAWARALLGASVVPVAGGFRIDVGAQSIELLEPRSAAERFGLALVPRRARAVGLELAVSDPGACRAELARGHVLVRGDGERLLVGPEDACGVAIAWDGARPPRALRPPVSHASRGCDDARRTGR